MMKALVCNLVVAAAFVVSPSRHAAGRPPAVARVADEVDVCGPGAAYLSERLEMSAAELRSLARTHPAAVAQYDPDAKLRPNLDFLARRLELSRAQLRRVVLGAPAATLGLATTTNLAPTLDFLAAALGLDGAADDAAATDALRRVVLRLPGVLGLSVANNLAPKLEFLDRALGLSGDPVPLRRVVLGAPSVLGLSVEANLAPKLAFLDEQLGLGGDPAPLRKIVLRAPQVLSLSAEANLRPTLALLTSRLTAPAPAPVPAAGGESAAAAGAARAAAERAADARSLVAKVVLGYPSVLTLSVASLDAKLAYLEARLELSPAQLSHVVATMPQALGLSVEANLEPKLAFLAESLGIVTTSALAELVARDAKVLSASLERRLRPRRARVLAVDRKCASRAPSDKAPELRIDRACLRSMTKLTDGEFDAWLARREARGADEAERMRAAALGAADDEAAAGQEDIARWLRRRQAGRTSGDGV